MMITAYKDYDFNKLDFIFNLIVQEFGVIFKKIEKF